MKGGYGAVVWLEEEAKCLLFLNDMNDSDPLTIPWWSLCLYTSQTCVDESLLFLLDYSGLERSGGMLRLETRS